MEVAPFRLGPPLWLDVEPVVVLPLLVGMVEVYEPDELEPAIEARVFAPTAPYPVVAGVPLETMPFID